MRLTLAKLLVLTLGVHGEINQTLDTCVVECIARLQESVAADTMCLVHEQKHPEINQDCVLGVHVGTEIGCLHRCRTPRTDWNVDATRVRRAEVAACGSLNNATRSYYPDCQYGFEAVLKHIFFRRWPNSDAPALDDDREYLVLPVNLPSRALVYVYCHAKASIPATATSFCLNLALGNAALELECGRQVLQGLWDRAQAQDWQRSKQPKMLLLLPVTVDDREMRLAVYEGQTPVVTAVEFCAQLKPSATPLIQDQCVGGILPLLQREMRLATGY